MTYVIFYDFPRHGCGTLGHFHLTNNESIIQKHFYTIVGFSVVGQFSVITSSWT